MVCRPNSVRGFRTPTQWIRSNKKPAIPAGSRWLGHNSRELDPVAVGLSDKTVTVIVVAVGRREGSEVYKAAKKR